MLEHVQIIHEAQEAKFAVIPYTEYLLVKELLSNQDKLADYLDYLHMEQIKQNDKQRLSLAAVRQALELDTAPS